MKTSIREIPVSSRIRILDHVFNGLQEIRNAVEAYSRIDSGLSANSRLWRTEPKKPVPDIHIVMIYEPYPCFDSDDYCNENRDYCNYFFSARPFTDDDINRLAEMRHGANYQMVTDGMDQDVLPAVYHNGDSDKMTIATMEP